MSFLVGTSCTAFSRYQHAIFVFFALHFTYVPSGFKLLVPCRGPFLGGKSSQWLTSLHKCASGGVDLYMSSGGDCDGWRHENDSRNSRRDMTLRLEKGGVFRVDSPRVRRPAVQHMLIENMFI